MKKTIKTNAVLTAYNIINTAKYAKMEDSDKIKVWKICRALKPVATRFEEDSKDAAEKLKPTEDFSKRLEKAQEYERLRKEGKPATDVMTTSEYNAFVKEFNTYNDNVTEAVREFADKETEFDFEPLSEEAFGKLMASNEWTVEQAMLVGDLVCEQG